MTEEIRRISERKNLRPPFQQMLRWHGRSGDHDATMHDVSMHGCFLNTLGDAEVGDAVRVSTALPSGEPVEIRGVVVHKQHPKLYGFGVKFEELAETAHQYLQLLMTEAAQS